jgi:hypothetical protein
MIHKIFNCIQNSYVYVSKNEHKKVGEHLYSQLRQDVNHIRDQGYTIRTRFTNNFADSEQWMQSVRQLTDYDGARSH